MIVTLTRPENRLSADRLGYPVYLETHSIPAGCKVVRWGNGIDPDLRGWDTVLNKASVLAISTNKLEALRSMARVVITPKLYEEGDRVPRGEKVVVRPDSHSQGSDFELVTSSGLRGYEVPEGKHATEFISPSREYRVWFVRGNYIVAKRVPRTSQGQSASDPCRSEWGYEFCSGVFPKLKEEMDKARQAIPLDFGAVDVLWTDDFRGSGEGKWVFLEFNSAPSLDHDRVLGHFKTHLQSILGPQTAQTVPEPVRAVETRQIASQTPPARSQRTSTPPSGDWKARYRAQIEAEVEAEKERIRREVYGSL